MTDDKRGRFFRAWADSAPSFDPERGRERFLLAKGRAAPRRGVRLFAAIALAAAFALAAFFGWSRWSAPLTFVAQNQRGDVGAWLATDAKAELPLRFSEGTEVVLRPDSRGRVERLDRGGAHFLLERGAFRADIVHRTGTEWRFHAGPFEVVVTGTSLGVAWDPQKESLAIEVTNGAVIVKGPYVGGDRIVRAGERCTVDVAAKSMHLATIDPLPPSRTPVEAEVPSATASSDVEPAPFEKPKAIAPSPATPSWSSLEDQGDHEGAYSAAEHAGFASLYAKGGADDLLRLSQVARLTGHREVEREALLACRRRFPGSAGSGLAAYELGRASAPAEAVTWFEAYLREVPSGSLAREALGRLVESQTLAGNRAAAREAAKRYLARYPDGPHAALARRIAEGHDE